MASEPPLKIIIIGAGLGGCTAAFCFARNGHQVKVFEQRSSLSPKGNGIMIRPPASKIFQSWGLGPDFEAISDTSLATFFRDMRTGEIASRNVAVEIADSPDWGTDRQIAQKLLYDCASRAGAEIEFGAHVEDVHDTAEEATIRLKGGRVYKADLVLAADGIRSRIRSKILADIKEPIDPILSKITLYGVRLPVDELISNTNTKSLVNEVSLNVWMGKNLQVVGRSSHKLNRFGGVFGIVADHTDQKGFWDEDGDIEYVRNAFAGTDPALQAVLSLSTTCDRWKLAEMPKLSRWTSENGRIALLGDSAHAMLPNAAHGFSQIVEDVGVLEYLLAAKRSAGIPAITDMWQMIRIPRVERIKQFAAWNSRVFVGEELVNPLAGGASRSTNQPSGQTKSLKMTTPESSAPFHTAAFFKWSQDYDAVAEAKKYLEGLRAKI